MHHLHTTVSLLHAGERHENDNGRSRARAFINEAEYGSLSRIENVGRSTRPSPPNAYIYRLAPRCQRLGVCPCSSLLFRRWRRTGVGGGPAEGVYEGARSLNYLTVHSASPPCAWCGSQLDLLLRGTEMRSARHDCFSPSAGMQRLAKILF